MHTLSRSRFSGSNQSFRKILTKNAHKCMWTKMYCAVCGILMCHSAISLSVLPHIYSILYFLGTSHIVPLGQSVFHCQFSQDAQAYCDSDCAYTILAQRCRGQNMFYLMELRFCFLILRKYCNCWEFVSQYLLPPQCCLSKYLLKHKMKQVAECDIGGHF